MYVAQNADDVSFVKQCLAGDTAAFGVLVERYQRVLFSVAVRMLGDYDEATDAAQNAFVKAYQKLDSFDAGQRFFSWLYRILLNECLNAQRARRGREALSDDFAVERDPGRDLEREERRRAVQHAILALPHDLRQVVVLRHFGELSYDEIAEAVGTSAGVVKSRLHEAKRKLGKLLGDLRTTS